MLKHLFRYDGVLEGDCVLRRQAWEDTCQDVVAESNDCVDEIQRCLRISEDKLRKNVGEVEEGVVLMEVGESCQNHLPTHFKQQPNLHALVKAHNLPPLLLGIPDGVLFEHEERWRNVDDLSQTRIADALSNLLKHPLVIIVRRKRVDREENLVSGAIYNQLLLEDREEDTLQLPVHSCYGCWRRQLVSVGAYHYDLGSLASSACGPFGLHRASCLKDGLPIGERRRDGVCECSAIFVEGDLRVGIEGLSQIQD